MHLGKQNKLLLENTAWLMVLQVVNILLPFVTVPYVTRVFGVESYGIFSIALNWITYFQLIIEYGFNLSATRRIAMLGDSTESIERVMSAVVGARVILLLACFALCIALCAVAGIPEEQSRCMIVLFSMLLGIALQLNWLFQGLQDMKVITIATAISRAASVLLIFLLINSPDSLELYAFLYSITFLLSALITHWVAWRKYRIRLHVVSVHELIDCYKDGFAIFISSAAGKAIGSVGVTVLSFVATPSTVGSYTAILKIPQLVTMMFSPIGQAIYPRVNQEFAKSTSSAIKFVVKIAVPVIALFMIILAILTFFRVQLVVLLFGIEYLECVNVMIPLSIWVVLGIVNNFLGIQLCIPMGLQRAYSIAMAIDAGFAIVADLLLGYIFGAMGVAVGAALGEAFLSIILCMLLVNSLKGKNEKGNACFRDTSGSNKNVPSGK